jgi:hypothetical protein
LADAGRLQPPGQRADTARAQISGGSLAFLVAFRARDLEQPRIRIECLDHIRDSDRHQFTGAKARIIGDRQQRAVTQPGERIAAGLERGADIDPARRIGERIPDRALEAERARLLLRDADGAPVGGHQLRARRQAEGIAWMVRQTTLRENNSRTLGRADYRRSSMSPSSSHIHVKS